MQPDVIVDTKGMACPMPIVKAKKALDGLQTGGMRLIIGKAASPIRLLYLHSSLLCAAPPIK